ncbi:MAG: AMP-binding protein [Candidatus Dormibacteraeota bacterium]|nr:AMP-binding protein [Candidatus Dormibacteraeota bacterium]
MRMTVAELIDNHAALGDHLAYALGGASAGGYGSPERPGTTLSYAQLAEVTRPWRQMAREQLHQGRAVLQVSDPLRFTVAFLGLMAGGATVVPLDPNAPEEERRRLVNLLGGDVLVTDHTAEDAVPVWSIGESGAAPADLEPMPPTPRRPPLDPHPALILSSSGTTGVPKVIPLSERQLLYVAGKVADHHRLNGDERGYNPLPLFHVNAEVVGLLSTLVAGSSLILDPKFRRTGFWDLVDHWDVTWINAVPAILAILARSDGPSPEVARRIRFARSASAPLPVPVLEEFEARTGIPVVETYGMTEAAAQITANPIPPQPRRAGSPGIPVGVEVRVVDARGNPSRAGTVGAVEIKGLSVIEHYLVPGTDEQLRPAREPSGWLRTGDLGYFDGDGYLFLAGRADDVINRGGEKVYPRPIEDLLRLNSEVVEVAVIGEPDSILGQCPVAYVIPSPTADPERLQADLERLARSRLGPPHRPVAYHLRETLPAGPTGKISRKKLRDLVAQEAGA